MDGQLVCKPFNAVYFGVFAVFGLLFLAGVLLLRNKTEKTKASVLAVAMFLTLVFFFWYKFMLSRDEEFSVLTEAAGIGKFNWWGELPLQLCNINMILIPFAALTKKRALLCFSFFMGPLGAFLALAMPSAGFEHYSILLPRMIGFYGTHWMVFFGSLALAAFGLYKPRFKDLPLTALSAAVILTLIFLLNVLLRKTGLNEHSNYFFANDPETNSILQMFYKWIPVPGLYLLPGICVLVPYVTIVSGISKGVERLKNREKVSVQQ